LIGLPFEIHVTNLTDASLKRQPMGTMDFGTEGIIFVKIKNQINPNPNQSLLTVTPF